MPVGDAVFVLSGNRALRLLPEIGCAIVEFSSEYSTMYEIGMSSDGRKEPVFDNALPAESAISPQVNLAQGHNTIISDPFIYEEEPAADSAAILLRCGIVVAVALGAFGGYRYHQANVMDTQIAGEMRTDWAGRPLATNDAGDLVWPNDKAAPRNIDLTTTASIPSKQEPKVIEAEPLPIGGAINKNAKFHVVESGDTLSAIARAHKVSTSDIMEINSIENPRRIKPGMKLYVTR